MIDMLKTLETLKDSAESAFDTAMRPMDNRHRLVASHLRTGIRSDRLIRSSDRSRQPGIYGVLRGMNQEVGSQGSDRLQIVDDAQAQRRAERHL